MHSEKCIKDFIRAYSACPACTFALTLEDISAMQTAFNEIIEIDENEQEDEKEEKYIRRVAELSSSKIETLLIHLESFSASDPAYKCVVFSQWTSMLKLISLRLDVEGIGWRMLDGSMSRSSRVRSQQEFEQDSSLHVYLVSLTAGNLGINLTMANRVVLFDPWWNPATESQAIDRVHRVGQRRAVEVFKYIVLETVEDRILALQARKREMFEAAVESRISREDIRTLFL
jgi:SNF2 family DNA or RNA helicase